MKVLALPLGRIRLDGDTQPRVVLDREHAEELAEALRGGVELPAATVFHDGRDYWLAAGFHRYHAHALAGRACMECQVREGTVEDARLFAASTNKSHGLKRSAADKFRAVHLCLTSPLAEGWSAQRVARHCQVPVALVDAVCEAPASPQTTIPGVEAEPPPVTPAGRLAAGGTLRAEDKPLLTEADRELIRKQIGRLIAKYLRKVWFLDREPVEYLKAALEGGAG